MPAPSDNSCLDNLQAAHLNTRCGEEIDIAALKNMLATQGKDWAALVAERCPHLFASVPVFVSPSQMAQMRALIATVERVVHLPGWSRAAAESALGVFYGYDFHLDENGAHLIEVNTNAGGAFVNVLLQNSQNAETGARLEQDIVAMFRHEWQLTHGRTPLTTLAIVDEQPEQQYLYPEFLLAQAMFERAGIRTHIIDAAALQLRGDGVYAGESRVDLIYNRLTDFSLACYPALLQAYRAGQVLLTPSPAHYERYADKRNLARLSDTALLHKLGVGAEDIAVLQRGLPQTVLVQPDMEEGLWAQRKQWFFKPVSGYGSKGAYRGEKITKRVFSDIMQGGYIAQHLAPPGERMHCPDAQESQRLKFDVRCYVYDGQIQIIAARLYQGQTTNFRTPGGGFSIIENL